MKNLFGYFTEFVNSDISHQCQFAYLPPTLSGNEHSSLDGGSKKSVSVLDDLEIFEATQELLRDIEAEETKAGNDDFELGNQVEVGKEVSSTSNLAGSSGSVSLDLANSVPLIDPRMAGFLHNLQNTGNITINFNFDRK